LARRHAAPGDVRARRRSARRDTGGAAASCAVRAAGGRHSRDRAARRRQRALHAGRGAAGAGRGMTLAMQVLQRLAAARAAEEGTPQFVSGAALAAEFAVTRSAIWKAMGLPRGRGPEVQASTHRGYRLVRPASPLTAAGVLQRLSPGVRARLREGRCATEIASTNSELLERGAPPPGRFDFLTAEYQSAGRGRMGRSWLAPPG